MDKTKEIVERMDKASELIKMHGRVGDANFASLSKKATVLGKLNIRGYMKVKTYLSDFGFNEEEITFLTRGVETVFVTDNDLVIFRSYKEESTILSFDKFLELYEGLNILINIIEKKGYKKDESPSN